MTPDEIDAHLERETMKILARWKRQEEAERERRERERLEREPWLKVEVEP
jgi:hypothetical protein